MFEQVTLCKTSRVILNELFSEKSEYTFVCFTDVKKPMVIKKYNLFILRVMARNIYIELKTMISNNNRFARATTARCTTIYFNIRLIFAVVVT